MSTYIGLDWLCFNYEGFFSKENKILCSVHALLYCLKFF
ncbi:uncharacterized protein MP3633_3233 [Marinomonas primoryensis]|uniref:Transposase n=1 Tax=Marinomonas primoryensis TaxID=178399 RepID=A0A859D3Y3_9GAMM|nr:uncharacterized protein MP3633_3233 [Marinomonas primoryensis]